MTLQEAKEQTAKKYGYDKWYRIDMYQLCEMYNVKHADAFKEAIHDEAAELYARSKWDNGADEQRELIGNYLQSRRHNVYLDNVAKPEFKP